MDTLHRYTEREKQIAAASLGYANEICKNKVLGKYNISDQEEIGMAFFNGAMLADTNPRPGLVDIEDVGDIYMTWLKEGECGDFVDYLKEECRKVGWL